MLPQSLKVKLCVLWQLVIVIEVNGQVNIMIWKIPFLPISILMVEVLLAAVVYFCCDCIYYFLIPHTGKLRLSGNHTVTEYEMSREPYSQKSGWIKQSNEPIFQVMTFK